ncbi:hypothetical protein D3C80_1375300 [compost metagenome]
MDQLALAVFEQIGGDNKIVGHHGDIVTVTELTSQGQRGGACVQIDATVGRDLPRGQLPNSGFLLAEHPFLILMRRLNRHALGRLYAAGDGQYTALLFQFLQIAPDGHMRDPQPFGQFSYADCAALGHQRQNLLVAFNRYHGFPLSDCDDNNCDFTSIFVRRQ